MKSFRLLRKKSEHDVKHQIPEKSEHTTDSRDDGMSPSSSSSRSLRKQNSGRIPFHDRKSHPLSPDDRALIAQQKRLSHCGKCGIQTHTVKRSMHKKSYLHMTNDNVYQGICIACNPSRVPDKVLRQFKRDHSSHWWTSLLPFHCLSWPFYPITLYYKVLLLYCY